MRKKLFSILALLLIVSGAWAKTVYFTNSQGWTEVKVYYWGGNGPECSAFPGNPMAWVGHNNYDQLVYSATIPNDVTGIIFSGKDADENLNKTKDITENIDDGNRWYLGDYNSNESKWEFGYTTDLNISTYYVYGDVNNWTENSIYKLQPNTETAGEYLLHGVALEANTYIKVHSSETTKKWYPDGSNYKINTAGIYSIYFRPNGNNAWGDTYYFTAVKNDVINVNVTMAEEGYGTYYNSKYDAKLPAGVTAKIVTAADNNGKLTYRTIATGDDNSKSSANTVPAGTAVLLQGTSGNLTLSMPSLNKPSTNYLHGSDVITTTSGGNTFYKLSYQENYTESDKIIGWYWGAANGGIFTSDANKAWLALPTSGARAFFDLSDSDEKTGISATRIETNDNWYSIDGRRLTGKPSQRGVYINNGKKLIIK
jgi:hypothetical protein